MSRLPRLPSGPVAKYYVYAGTQAAWFVTPVWTIFLLSKDLSYTQLSILNAVWWVAIVGGEVPTGYVGDRIGRRNSLVIGSVTHLVCVAVFGFLNTFPSILAIYAVWGIGATFRSGSEDAWLYDTLEERIDAEDFTHVKGRGSSIGLAMATVSALLGGYLYRLDPYYPFLLSAAVIGVGTAVVATIPETERYLDGDGDPFTPGDALPVIRDTLLAPGLRPFVLALLSFVALGWGTIVFTQPIARDVWLGLGLPAGRVEPMLGWLYAGFSALSAVATYYADAIERVVGTERWMRVAPLLLGAAFVLTALLPVAAVPTFFLIRVLLEPTNVLKARYVNDRTPSLGRATVLSAVSMLLAAARVPARLAAGVLGDSVGPYATIGVFGAGLVGLTLALALWAPMESGAEKKATVADAD